MSYDHTDLGVDLIRAERERQIIDEGHTPEHDAQHDPRDLVDAAAAYALAAPVLWPWESSSYRAESKPDGEATIRDLVKAGALIAAAVDRLLADEAPSR